MNTARIRRIVQKTGITKRQGIIFCAVILSFLLFWLCTNSKTVCNAVTFCTDWLKWGLAHLCALVSFSVTELVIVLAVIAVIVFFIWLVRRAKKNKGRRIAVMINGIFSAVLAVLIGVSAFDWMYGVNYYESSLQEKLGIYARPVSADELYKTASYFLTQANETAALILRDSTGDLLLSPYAIAAMSTDAYAPLFSKYEVLRTPLTVPKVLVLSKGLSYLNCTGFFFPYLGESNINGDVPKTTIPSTAMHELAHQMGIASEQEANFLAVLGCVESGIDAFSYSGWQMGLIHLTNALYRADQTLWESLMHEMSTQVRDDLVRINTYWAPFDTPVGDAANAINNDRLSHYGQDLTTQSYGAVVDLLVVYFSEVVDSAA